ncbi:MAG: tetratricopeptide repeat protein [Candidatus Schekmanbacteria bacterium]|nr:tetratricopeptide repeat protein [Candidatus Schekmanbacteria bacterium]
MSIMPKEIGPYRILAPLSSGSMGVVYRAEHLQSAAPAAVKTVLLAHEGMLESIRHEIRALARLRHPGIVRVLDEGVCDGLPWVATELIEGETLETWCRAHWDPASRPHPGRESERLRAVLEVMRRICSPLGYLHGEGIVHRDLKPKNILVRDRDEPIIVDLGLMSQFAGHFSREHLEVADAGGSPGFIAPEQMRGEPVDARADLFSFGCILYLMLTGEPAFSTTRALLDADTRPTSLKRHIPDMPDKLDRLVNRLLAKAPHERFGYADDVAAALEELGGGPDGYSGAPAARPYLYRPRFCGRDQLVSALANYVAERLDAGRGDFVVIGGESGIGKTRFASELGNRAQRRGYRVLTGECLSLSGAEGQRGETRETLHAFKRPLQAIADRCRQRGDAEVERILGARGPVLSLFQPALNALPGQRDHGPPPELPPDAARTRLFDALFETLAEMASDAPIVLILDDLHWADEATVDFLSYVLARQRLASAPIVIVGTVRTDEASPALRRLLSREGIRQLRLGQLDDGAVESIVGDMLALYPPPKVLVDFLGRHGAGNPFFVAEYLQLAVSEGALLRDFSGHWRVRTGLPNTKRSQILPVPGSIREVVARRLAGLEPAARSLVEAAAVLGREGTRTMLARMTELDGTDFALGLNEALLRRLLEEPEPGTIRFTHDKIREVVYEQIAPPMRRQLHGVAAAGGDSWFGSAKDEHLATMAFHWEKAGEPARARSGYLAGARKAVAACDYREAERLYTACLSLCESPSPEGVTVRNELARNVLSLQGRGAEALRTYERAFEEAQRLADGDGESQSLQGMAHVYRDSGQTNKAWAFYQQALAVHRRIGKRNRESVAMTNLALILVDRGQLTEARDFYRQALEIHRERGDWRSEVMALGDLAILHHNQGLVSEAKALYRQAQAVLERMAGDFANAEPISNIGLAYREQSLLGEARTYHEQVLKLHRTGGDRRREAIALSNLAQMHHDDGVYEDALALCEQALAQHRKLGDRRWEAIAVGLLASVCAALGRVEEAYGHYKSSLAIHQEVGNRRMEGDVLCDYATLIRRAGGDLEEAFMTVGRAAATADDLGNKLVMVKCLCEGGHIALARASTADQYLQRACAFTEASQLGPEGTLSRRVAGLARAVTAVREGRPLFRGEHIQDIPPGMRGWLVERGDLSRQTIDE